jgi:VanZ family protein
MIAASRILSRAVIVVTAIYWAIIFTLTHLPPRNLPQVNLWDKLEHFLAFGCLGGLLYITLWILRPRTLRLWLIVMLIAMAYGAIDEISQIPVGRDCSIRDWTADVLGMGVAVGVLTLLRHLTHNAQHTIHNQISNRKEESSKSASAGI